MKILEHYKAQLPQESPMPLLSVIVAVYNIKDYVEKGISSIIMQTYSRMEIIVVDDGSTDESGAVCDRLAMSDDRIRVIHKENGGLADARNAGLADAKGEYVAFVDGDDWIDSVMYERMLAAMLEQGADMAVCRYRQVYASHTEDDSRDRVVVFEGQEALQSYVEEREEFAIQNAAWNKVFRRESLEGVRFPKGKYYEDILFTTKLLAASKRCVYLDTAYYNYIIDREGSIMNQRIDARIFTDLLPAYQDKTEYLKGIGREDLAATHDYFIYKRLLLFYNRIKKAGAKDRRQYLKEITERITSDRPRLERAYQCEVAAANEKKKMDIFLRSRLVYGIVMWLNEKIVLPMKLKRLDRHRSMVIIQMMGGLGNQMFQYALYRQLLHMGKEVRMDDVTGFRDDAKRDPALEIFGMTYKRATKKEIERITDSSPRLLHKVRRKLFGRKKKSYFEENKLFQEKIFGWDDIYLEGYWQSERYFKDVSDMLRLEYAPGKLLEGLKERRMLSSESEAYLEKIRQTQSVSVHIRRGDYLLPENQELFGAICTEDYYKNAVRYMCREVREPVFYLFTNDILWAKEQKTRLEEFIRKEMISPEQGKESEGERLIVVEVPEERDYEAMCLMASCKHNVLANSSYSWWASYLNDDPDKKVIAPPKWLNGWDCRDIYRDDMTVVGQRFVIGENR